MEDLIPLFIVILIGIVGALTRKKRKRLGEEEIVEPRQQSSNDDLFAWLNKFEEEEPGPEQSSQSGFFDKTDYQEVVEVENKPIIEKTPVQNKYSGYSGVITDEEKARLMAKEGVSALNKKTDQLVDEKTEGAQEGKIQQPKHKKAVPDFDLKKAVIYSEILNRKYVD